MSATSRTKNITDRVREFYNRFPFPGYEVGDYQSVASLYEKASPYVRMLDQQMQAGTCVLDAGCGTGQLSALLSLANRSVLGIDLSESSIQIANSLKARLNLPGVTFMQADIFEVDLPQTHFDYIFCNGVLHHTYDPYGGFIRISTWLKPGGYIIIGLYNAYGRLFTKMKTALFRRLNATVDDRITQWDHFLRKEISAAQKRSWFFDQYHHPHETVHTIDEVLGWFRQNRIDYVNGLPKIRLFEYVRAEDRLFEKSEPGGRIQHMFVQLGWILSTRKEGGYFLLIGQKE